MQTFQKKYYLFKELRILFEIEKCENPVFKPADPEICGEPFIDPAPIELEQAIVTIKGPVEEENEIQKVLEVLPENGRISELRFDGRYVKMAINDPRTGKAVEISIPAASGKPDEDGNFDYSVQRWDIKKQGPIPPGKWIFKPESVHTMETADKIKGLIGRGKWKGGTKSWGDYRVDLQPADYVAASSTRTNLFIHGGTSPGSAGCLDMVRNNNLFFAIIEKYKAASENAYGSLVIKVDYMGLEGQRIAYENPDIRYTVAPRVYAKNQSRIARTDLEESITI